jgi:hypothetical protein
MCSANGALGNIRRGSNRARHLLPIHTLVALATGSWIVTFLAGLLGFA